MIIQVVIMDDAYTVIEKCTFKGSNASEKLIRLINDKYSPKWYVSKFFDDLDQRWYNRDRLVVKLRE